MSMAFHSNQLRQQPTSVKDLYGIRPYPVERLYVINIEEENRDIISEYMEKGDITQARPMNKFELSVIQGAYIWVQTYLKLNETIDFIFHPPVLDVSYTELWWILQSFLNMVNSTRMVHKINPALCEPHRALFNQVAREYGLPDWFINWDRLTLLPAMYTRVKNLMMLLNLCAAFEKDITLLVERDRNHSRQSI
jgi:hypothetical protein